MSSSSTRAVAQLLEQVSRTLHARGHIEHLYPAQWSALRYFAMASPAQRNASSLARYQGIALAPVSRTVKTLEEKGYLTRESRRGGQIASRVDLTESGRQVLDRDPLIRITDAIEQLPDADKPKLIEMLQTVIFALHDLPDQPDSLSGGAPRKQASKSKS